MSSDGRTLAESNAPESNAPVSNEGALSGERAGTDNALPDEPTRGVNALSTSVDKPDAIYDVACHPVCRLISGLIQPLPIRSPSSLASPPMLRRWPWPVVDFLTAAVMLTLRACLLLPWLHPLLWLVPGV